MLPDREEAIVHNGSGFNGLAIDSLIQYLYEAEFMYFKEELLIYSVCAGYEMMNSSLAIIATHSKLIYIGQEA